MQLKGMCVNVHYSSRYNIHPAISSFTVNAFKNAFKNSYDAWKRGSVEASTPTSVEVGPNYSSKTSHFPALY